MFRGKSEDKGKKQAVMEEVNPAVIITLVVSLTLPANMYGYAIL